MHYTKFAKTPYYRFIFLNTSVLCVECRRRLRLAIPPGLTGAGTVARVADVDAVAAVAVSTDVTRSSASATAVVIDGVS